MARFRSLYQDKEAKVNSLLIFLDLRSITKEEAKMLDEFIKVMAPLSVALDELQGEQEVNIGYLLPTLHAIGYYMYRLFKGTWLRTNKGTLFMYTLSIGLRQYTALHPWLLLASLNHQNLKRKQ